MMPIISGGNDAFEKSFISVSILFDEASSRSLATSERSAAIDWLARTFGSISAAQIASLRSRGIQRPGMQVPNKARAVAPGLAKSRHSKTRLPSGRSHQANVETANPDSLLRKHDVSRSGITFTTSTATRSSWNTVHYHSSVNAGDCLHHRRPITPFARKGGPVSRPLCFRRKPTALHPLSSVQSDHPSKAASGSGYCELRKQTTSLGSGTYSPLTAWVLT